MIGGIRVGFGPSVSPDEDPLSVNWKIAKLRIHRLKVILFMFKQN